MEVSLASLSFPTVELPVESYVYQYCPSAASGVNVSELLMEIIDKEIYKEDYASITTYFQREPISYDDAIKSVEIIARSGIFEE
ncbi:MAG: hypothetical protein PUF62_11705 [Bacteroidales bacterium]|nr:hypothetical protein [Bacteroidales bacterium]